MPRLRNTVESLANLKVTINTMIKFKNNSEEKREHHQKITSLKNQLKDEQKYSDEQEELLGKNLEVIFEKP